jgi:hypothetical protein
VPLIVDQSGNIITASANNDETYLGVEEQSGVTLITQQRLQTNFGIFNDELVVFNSGKLFGQYIPLVLIDRESRASQSQVKSMFSAYYSAITLKWVLTGVFIGLGVIGLGIGGFMIFKVNKLAKAAQQTINSSDSERNLL